MYLQGVIAIVSLLIVAATSCIFYRFRNKAEKNVDADVFLNQWLPI